MQRNRQCMHHFPRVARHVQCSLAQCPKCYWGENPTPHNTSSNRRGKQLTNRRSAKRETNRKSKIPSTHRDFAAPCHAQLAKIKSSEQPYSDASINRAKRYFSTFGGSTEHPRAHYVPVYGDGIQSLTKWGQQSYDSNADVPR